MISKDKITEIFCSIDDFCAVYEPAMRKRQLTTPMMQLSKNITTINKYHLYFEETFYTICICYL